MYPQKNAEFVACVEDILAIYERPYHRQLPVICMDEKPYQLLGEVRGSLSMRPGGDLKTDSDYKRNGTCSIFVFTEPLAGLRHVSACEHRTAKDWAEEIRYLAHRIDNMEHLQIELAAWECCCTTYAALYQISLI